MEKYRRVRPAREPLGLDEVRVTTLGRVSNYVSYASSLIEEQHLRKLTIKASGSAIGQAISLVEQLKRRFKGLHQQNICGNTTVSVVYEPIEEGLDTLTQQRTVAFLEVKLSLDPIDSNIKGYQPPLDDAAFEEFKQVAAAAAATGNRGRGGYRGGMRGRGVSRGMGVEGEEEEIQNNQIMSEQQNNNEGVGTYKGRGRGRGGYRGGYRGGFRGAPRGAPRGGRGE